MAYHHAETNPHFVDPEELTEEQRQYLPSTLLPRRDHAHRMPSRGRHARQPQPRQSQEEHPRPLGPSPPQPPHEGQPHLPLHVWVPPVHHEDQSQPQSQPRQGQQRQPVEMWVPPTSKTQVPASKKEKSRPRKEVGMQPQLQDQHPEASLVRSQPEHHPSPVTMTPRHHDRQPEEPRSHSRLLPQDRRTGPHTWFGAVFCIIFWLVIIIGGIIVLIVYLVFRPRSPHFDVISVTWNAAYLDMGYLLNADLTVLANFTNPNKKVSVDFSYLYLDLYFENTLIATQYIEPFSATRGQSIFANIHMVSSQVKLSMKESMLLQKQIQNNRVIFTVKGMFRARSNLGSFLKYSYWLHGQCGIMLSSPPTGVLRDKKCKTKH